MPRHSTCPVGHSVIPATRFSRQAFEFQRQRRAPQHPRTPASGSLGHPKAPKGTHSCPRVALSTNKVGSISHSMSLTLPTLHLTSHVHPIPSHPNHPSKTQNTTRLWPADPRPSFAPTRHLPVCSRLLSAPSPCSNILLFGIHSGHLVPVQLLIQCS